MDWLFIAQIQDGPLAGVKGVQTTIGEYTIDDSEPVRQKVCGVSCPCNCMTKHRPQEQYIQMQGPICYLLLIFDQNAYDNNVIQDFLVNDF